MGKRKSPGRLSRNNLVHRTRLFDLDSIREFHAARRRSDEYHLDKIKVTMNDLRRQFVTVLLLIT